jgi:hypothetical protein
MRLSGENAESELLKFTKWENTVEDFLKVINIISFFDL